MEIRGGQKEDKKNSMEKMQRRVKRRKMWKLFYLKIPFVNPNVLYLSLEGSAKELQWNKMTVLNACRDVAIIEQERESAAMEVKHDDKAMLSKVFT